MLIPAIRLGTETAKGAFEEAGAAGTHMLLTQAGIWPISPIQFFPSPYIDKINEVL